MADPDWQAAEIATHTWDLATALDRTTAELDQSANAMAQHLYSKAGGQQGAAPSEGPAGPQANKGGPDDVIDAEYEVKK